MATQTWQKALNTILAIVILLAFTTPTFATQERLPSFENAGQTEYGAILDPLGIE